jgi:release factor glutamine methyltransferase
VSSSAPFAPDEVVLADVTARLRAAGCVFAEDEAAILLASALDGRQLRDYVTARVSGTPLEHVVGWAGFAGLRLVVGPGTFVPRRRSEFLAAVALERAVAAATAGTRPVVVEMCCGVAPIAAFVAETLPAAEVHAADIDPGQTVWALRNLSPRRGHVHLGDLYAALPVALLGRVDVLAANAPYVPTDHIDTLPSEARDHEPLRSLDGGRDGVDLHRRLAAEAAAWLAPGGTLLIETSDDQTDLTAEAFRAGGLHPTVLEDLDRDATVVAGMVAPPG